VSFLEIRTLRAQLRAVAMLGATGILAVAAAALWALGAGAAYSPSAVFARTGITLVLAVTGVFLLAVLSVAYKVAVHLEQRLHRVARHVAQLQEHGVAPVHAMLSALARGERVVVPKVTHVALRDDVPDELGGVAHAVDNMAQACRHSLEACAAAQQAIGTTVAEITRVADAAREGNLRVQVNAAGVEGMYADVLHGVDGVMQAVRAPLDAACVALEGVATRDLEARMSGQYTGEFARMQQAFGAAVHELAHTIGQVRTAAEHVNVAAQQLTDGSTSLANGASTQAAQAHDIGTALQDLTVRVTHAAQEVDGLRDRAATAADRASAGYHTMDALRQDMARIKQSADASQRIVKTIDEIAFQTNLLALNAAVEAARAGDAGRGFAVVADEVRALALRAAEAARQTSTFIEEEMRNVDAGVSREQQVRDALTAVRDDVLQMRSSLDGLSAGSSRQVEDVRQVQQGVDAMNEITRQVAASSEESAASAEELQLQAAQLSTLVQTFRTRDQVARGPDALSLDARRRGVA
jgi:methyl-accepting chemotaxis protein